MATHEPHLPDLQTVCKDHQLSNLRAPLTGIYIIVLKAVDPVHFMI